MTTNPVFILVILLKSAFQFSNIYCLCYIATEIAQRFQSFCSLCQKYISFLNIRHLEFHVFQFAFFSCQVFFYLSASIIAFDLHEVHWEQVHPLAYVNRSEKCGVDIPSLARNLQKRQLNR